MVHDTGGGGEDDVAELTGREQLDNPLLELGETDVVAGRDDTGLVETAVELDNDLAGSVVVNLLELANATGGVSTGWYVLPKLFNLLACKRS